MHSIQFAKTRNAKFVSKLFNTNKSIYQLDQYPFLGFAQSQVWSSLRGGGCGNSRPQIESKTLSLNNQLPADLISSLQQIGILILNKSTIIQDGSNKQVVMKALQWCHFMGKYFQQLNYEPRYVSSSYEIISGALENFLLASKIYVKSNPVICFFVLQTAAKLSQVIFSYFVANKKRYMDIKEQEKMFQKLDEVKETIEIEDQNDCWKNGLLFYLSIVKAAFVYAPTNSTQGQELLATFIGQLIRCGVTMSLNAEIFSTMAQGIKFLYQENQNRKLIQIFKVYYYEEFVGHKIIYELENGSRVKICLNLLSEMYDLIVKNKNFWEVHYIWLKLLGDIFSFNPIISKQQIKSFQSQKGIDVDLWRMLKDLNLIIPLNNSSTEGIFLHQNEKIMGEQMDYLLVQYIFKGDDQLKLLQKILCSSFKENDINFQSFSEYWHYGLAFQANEKEPKSSTQKYEELKNLVLKPLSYNYSRACQQQLQKVCKASLKSNEQIAVIQSKYLNLEKKNSDLFIIEIEELLQCLQDEKDSIWNLFELKQQVIGMNQVLIKLLQFTQERLKLQEEKGGNDEFISKQIEILFEQIQWCSNEIIQMNQSSKNNEDNQVYLDEISENYRFLESMKSESKLTQHSLTKLMSEIKKMCTFEKSQPTPNSIKAKQWTKLNQQITEFKEQIQKNRKTREPSFDLIYNYKKWIAPWLIELRNINEKLKIDDRSHQAWQNLVIAHEKLQSFIKMFKANQNSIGTEQLSEVLDILTTKRTQFFQHSLGVIFKRYSIYWQLFSLASKGAVFFIESQENNSELNKLNEQIVSSQVDSKETQFILYKSIVSLHKYLNIDLLEFISSQINEFHRSLPSASYIQSSNNNLEYYLHLIFYQAQRIELFYKKIEIQFGNILQNLEQIKTIYNEQQKLKVYNEEINWKAQSLTVLNHVQNEFEQAIQNFHQNKQNHAPKLIQLPTSQNTLTLKNLQEQQKGQQQVENFIVLEQANIRTELKIDNLFQVKNQQIKQNFNVNQNQIIVKAFKQLHTLITQITAALEKCALSQQVGSFCYKSYELLKLIKEPEALIEKYLNESELDLPFVNQLILKTVVHAITNIKNIEWVPLGSQGQSLFQENIVPEFPNEIFEVFRKSIQFAKDNLVYYSKLVKKLKTIINFMSLSSISNDEILRLLSDEIQNLQSEVILYENDIINRFKDLRIQFTKLEEMVECLIDLKNVSYQSSSEICLKLNQIINQNLIFASTTYELGVDEVGQAKGKWWQISNPLQDHWKVRESLIVVMQNILMIHQDSQIQEYCTNLILKIKTHEKDTRVRQILKNQDFLKQFSKALLSKWINHKAALQEDMEKQLLALTELQLQISQEGQLETRQKLLLQLKERQRDLDDQIRNTEEMSSELNIVIEFTKDIRRSLQRLEQKIEQLSEQIYEIGMDVKFLKGKSVRQLLEMRMLTVLQEKARYDQQTVYVQLKCKEKVFRENSEKEVVEETPLLSNNKQDHKPEINEFLWSEKDKDRKVMLIHGQAGCGKSTASRKIEEFLWDDYRKDFLQIKWESLNNSNKKPMIPILVQLPALKNPLHQAFDETLYSPSYNFDKLQFNEFLELKDKVELIIIMDSYDELNQLYQQQNLTMTNKLFERWNPFKVIYTSRSEVFKNNYASWFYLKDPNQTYKEIRLLPFNYQQQEEYLNSYSILSLKKILIEMLEYAMNFQSKHVDMVSYFEEFWQNIDKSRLIARESESYLERLQIEYLVDELDSRITLTREQKRAVRVKLEQLWSPQRFSLSINNMELQNIIETPFMMELVVQILPTMERKYSDSENLKSSYIKKFVEIKKQENVRKISIQAYRMQKFSQSGNQIQESPPEQSIFIEKAYETWEKLVSQAFFQHFSIVNKLNPLKEQHEIEMGNVYYQSEDPDIVVLALQSQKITTFDFYKEFLEFYFFKQINKWKDLGETINFESILLDLEEYSKRLAIELTKRQLTQVIVPSQGILFKKNQSGDNWMFQFFNELDQNGEYRKKVRSGLPISQKAKSFCFNHKSIQEFLVAKDCYELVDQSSQLINLEIFAMVLEYCKLDFNHDDQVDIRLISYIDIQSQKIIETIMKNNSIKIHEQQAYSQEMKEKLALIQKGLNHIMESNFNIENYSSQWYEGVTKFIVSKIKDDEFLISFLKLICKISAVDKGFIRAASNSLHLLVQVQHNLQGIDLSSCRFENTSISGATLSLSKLIRTKMSEVNITGVNFNGAQLKQVQWDNMLTNELPSLRGHNEAVTSVCFSPDGNAIASGSADRSIRVWDVKSGNERQKFEGHTDYVTNVCFSPDGKTIASGSGDLSIRIWDAKQGNQIQQLDGHIGGVMSVCFSPDGQTITSGSIDRSIRIWNTSLGKDLLKLYGSANVVTSVCYSPDGKAIASGSVDRSIRIWDVKTGKETSKLDGHTDYVTNVCFSPDGNTIASGSADRSIRIWDVKTGQETSKLDGHTDEVTISCFSPDGKTLASGSADRSIRIWDVKTGKETLKLDGHTDRVLSVSFSPDGNTIASGSNDRSILLWDAKPQKESLKLDGHAGSVKSACFSPDGNSIASGGQDKSIRIWDAKSWKETLKLDGHTNCVKSVCFSPDGNSIASGSDDRSIRLWDAISGKEILIMNGHTKLVTSVCFSPDGNTIASGSDDGSIRLWDAKSGRQTLNLNVQTDIVCSVCFSPDGSVMASGSDDGSIRLWDAKSGKETLKLDGHTNFVRSVCFSLDGNTIASGSDDKSIRLWDAKSGKQTLKLDGHTDRVLSVSFSPDGNSILSGSVDKSIRLWDTKSGKQTLKLDGHTSSVSCVCFSPDGNTITSGSQDESIKIWQRFQGQELSDKDQLKELKSSQCIKLVYTLDTFFCSKSISAKLLPLTAFGINIEGAKITHKYSVSLVPLFNQRNALNLVNTIHQK